MRQAGCSIFRTSDLSDDNSHTRLEAHTFNFVLIGLFLWRYALKLFDAAALRIIGIVIGQLSFVSNG